MLSYNRHPFPFSRFDDKSLFRTANLKAQAHQNPDQRKSRRQGDSVDV